MATQQQTVLRVQTNIPGAISGSTTYEFLDLYSDIPIKINKSFAELQDISKRNSDYSIGLQLPGSKKNNKFFENFFNVDAQSLYFNAIQRVPCNVLLNDESYFTGYLKLNKTSVLDSKIEYDVTLYSSIGDLFGNIGNNLLKDLDYDTEVLGYDYAFNHQFNKYQVESWGDYNPYQSDYEPLFFYPIVHNGYNYSGDTVLVSGATTAEIASGTTRLYTTTIAGSYASYAAAYAAGVKRYRINSPEDGLIDNQLKPALSIRGLITLMFQTYGYTIKSDFFNTPWFRMLYMYGYFSSEATKFSYKVPPKSDAVSNDLAVKLTETYVDDTDPVCFNIRTTRTYTIDLVYRDNGVATTSDVPLDVVLLFKYYPCGSTTGYDQNVTVTIPANSSGTTYSWISNQFVPCPSSCALEYKQNFGVNNSLSDVPEYSDLPPNTIVIYEDNDQVEFDKVIDWNIKQIDILSSIAKKFNLVFIPDPDVPNQIIIEPYNYYIGTGDIHDWTPKLSYDKGFTVEPALNYVESEIILTDLEDGDYGNKTFKDRNNRLYGENKVYNPTAYKSQTKNIDTFFSPELVRQWDTIDTAPNGNVKLPLGINYSSSSSSQNSGGSEKIVWTYPGVKTKPKLMYWTGNFNPFLDQVGEAITYSGNVLTNVFYIAESDGDNPRQTYLAPIVGTTMPVGNSDNNKINNDSICNLFNSELPTDIGVTSFSAYTENDAYSLFYQNRIENLYDPNTRFLSGYFNLKYSDIKNLKPNDLIKINEQYFTWNKIDGFNLTNPELTKVELIQANNNPSEYPTRYFQYYYCDNTSIIYKFQTDMTNPSLSGTSFGWSATYDYNVGLLGGSVSGYTSAMRDFSQGGDYIPYYIYEVSESTYNTSGIDRSYDTEWTYLSNLNGDLNPSDFPSYVYTNGTPIKIISNIFTDCSNFNFYVSTYGIDVGSSTYHGIAPTQTPTPTPTITPSSAGDTRVRGSLLMSFTELVSDYGLDSYEVQVNGAVRDLHYTPITDLYSTYLYNNDAVTITLTGDQLENRQIDIYRVDYTTDASNGNMGIYEVGVTGVTGTSVSAITVSFVVNNIDADYNFEYRVGSRPIPSPTPTPTVTITSTLTPTPSASLPLTPTPSPSITPTISLTPSITPTNTVTPTVTPTLTPTPTFRPCVQYNVTNSGIDPSTIQYTDCNGIIQTIEVGAGTTIIIGALLGLIACIAGDCFSTQINQLATPTPTPTHTKTPTPTATPNATPTPTPLPAICFNVTTGTTGYVFSSQIQSDGKIYLGSYGNGSFTQYDGTSIPDRNVIRLNANGTFDTSFASSGMTNSQGSSRQIQTIEIQSDGKVLAGGRFTNYGSSSYNKIVRINTNGTEDSTFSIGTGFSLSGETVNKIQIQSDGKIIVAGQLSLYNGTSIGNIVRLNSNGSIDTSFSGGTGFNGIVKDILLQSDGKIFAVGTFTSYNGTSITYTAVLNSNGTLYSSYTGSTSATSLNTFSIGGIQSNGKYIIGGSLTQWDGQTVKSVVRLNTNGSIDTTFNSGLSTGVAYHLKVLSDDKILITGGGYTGNIDTYRLNSDGSLDSSFNAPTSDSTTYTFVTTDSFIVLGGTFTTFSGASITGVASITNSGSDNVCTTPSCFTELTGLTYLGGTPGRAYTSHIQSDGKILISGPFDTYDGNSNTSLMRLNSNGTFDSSFTSGAFDDLNRYAFTIETQSDGKILIGGNFTQYPLSTTRNRIVRLNSDGSVDTSFSIGTGFDQTVYKIQIQSNGKILVAGNFSSYNGTSVGAITRLNTDGTIDTSFSGGTGFNAIVNDMILQSDGKIFVVGLFTTYNGTSIIGTARLNSDGTLDGTYSGQTVVPVGGGTQVCARQSTGKYIIAGSFSQFNGSSTSNRIVRLNSNGSVDTSFTPSISFTLVSPTINTVKVSSTDKIMVGGNFYLPYNGVARLNSDGSTDSSFNPGTGTFYTGSMTVGTVRTISIQSNGLIIIGGVIQEYNGIFRNGLIQVLSNGSSNLC